MLITVADNDAQDPSMVVKTYTSATQCLLAELHGMVSLSEPQRVSEVSGDLQICLKTLEVMRKTLVTYPQVYPDKECTGVV